VSVQPSDGAGSGCLRVLLPGGIFQGGQANRTPGHESVTEEHSKEQQPVYSVCHSCPAAMRGAARRAQEMCDNARAQAAASGAKA
jgi:hypothetical protein